MKIIGGIFRSRNFYRPEGIRPTQNMAREALFDILGPEIKNISFLDLFAGSGAMGLEAVSRGAPKVIFVEKDQKCMNVIQENLQILMPASLKPAPEIELFEKDAFATIKWMAGEKRIVDIVFMDPPYDRGMAKKALKTLEAYDILGPNSMVIIQHDQREILPSDTGRFLHFRHKKYGSSCFDIYTVKGH